MSPSAMFLRRTAAAALSQRAVAFPAIRLGASRTFSTSIARCSSGGHHDHHDLTPVSKDVRGKMVPFTEVQSKEDLLPPGAEPGEMPTDENQSTGLERLEILGKMQGIDIFDMKPLDASRTGTLEDPIVVYSAGDEQFAGCTGCPADSHRVWWLGMDRRNPVERCWECGSVYKMEYIGPHDPHDPNEPLTCMHGPGPQHHHGDPNEPYDVYHHGHPDLIEAQNKPRWYDYIPKERRWT